LHHRDERHEIHTARPSVHDGFERRLLAPRIESPDVLGRARTRDRQHAFDRLNDTGDAAERERCGNESYDLTIVRSREPPHDLNGIGGRIGIVEAGVETVQRRPQRIDRQSCSHFDRFQQHQGNPPHLLPGGRFASLLSVASG